MTKFIVLRHGNTVDNGTGTVQGWNGSMLTDLGHEQALAAAHALPTKPDLIFASDLYRTQQTAAHIKEVHSDVHSFTDWRIRERSFGNLEGQQKDFVNWDEFFAVHDNESFHGAEPISFFNERIKSFIRSVHAFNVDTVLLVTHSGVLNRFGYLFSENFERIEYPNCAIVEYDIEPDDPRLVPSEPVGWKPYEAGA